MLSFYLLQILNVQALLIVTLFYYFTAINYKYLILLLFNYKVANKNFDVRRSIQTNLCKVILEIKENETYSLLEKITIQFIMYGERKQLVEILKQLYSFKCVSFIIFFKKIKI